MSVDVCEQAIIDAVQQTKQQWVSVEVKLEQQLDPITLFDMSKEDAGDRFYFRLNDNETSFFGYRVAAKIKNDFTNKRSIFKEWEKFKDDIALIHPDSERHHLRICGGFQFSTKRMGDEWRRFGVNHFILPEVLISQVNQETFLTYTVQKEAFLIEQFYELVEKLNHLPRVVVQNTTPPQIKRIEDIYKDEWEALVEETTAKLAHDEKVVLSRRRMVQFDADIEIGAVLYRALKNEKNSYLFALESEDDIFISQTPEQLFKVTNGMLSTKAVAGTIPRTHNEVQDQARINALLKNEKNLIEHGIVVESILEDIRPFIQYADYNREPQVLKNDHLYHLYTEIGGLLAHKSYIELIDDLHPTPALGGYPKARALEYIEAHEFGARGLYGAPVGMVDMYDDCEFIVAIRSMLMNHQQALLFAGAGIVKDSDAAEEVAETALKFKPMMVALGVSEHD
ncbi:isochorismate synthase [Staphylococcus ursi]|uniref:isochorismate synthase n=1 Tax=Staphylococcus sp. MI 10-1553 TaxID=1912064 RepID=UPI0013980652|nr:isochorismate synthase [Staphylococcus sp. MI 10-1553]QHW36530.1 isochorismate synthase [Staphylococcus sp. MI 10-1553]